MKRTDSNLQMQIDLRSLKRIDSHSLKRTDLRLQMLTGSRLQTLTPLATYQKRIDLSLREARSA